MTERKTARTGARARSGPDRIAKRGEEALRFLCGVMHDEGEKLDTRLQAAKMLLEYCLGKPAQAPAAQTGAPGPLEGMSMKERLALLKALTAQPDDRP